MSLRLKTTSEQTIKQNTNGGLNKDFANLYRLDNGVGVVIDPIPSLKSACIGVWVGIGTRHEDETNNGIAHFLEHLVFKGAAGKNATEIAEDAESRGIYLNAATSYERTGFYARCLGDEIEYAFQLCSDLVLRPNFDPKEAELEKSVVLHEINEAFDDAEDRCGVLNQLASFNNQPLGRPILGDADSLKKISMDEIHKFHSAYLNPENIILAFGGAVDVQKSLELANKYFGHLKPASKQNFIDAIVTKSHLFESRKAEQFQICMSFYSSNAGSNEMYASQIFASILGGGMASRLFQDLREKRGLVYGVDAYTEKYFDIGRFIISAGCSAQNTAEVVKRSQQHMEDLAIHGPSDDELKRAKKTFETALMLSLENPSSRINAAISQAFVLGQTIEIDEISRAIRETSADEIKKIANHALMHEYRAASGVGKKIGEKALKEFIN